MLPWRPGRNPGRLSIKGVQMMNTAMRDIAHTMCEARLANEDELLTISQVSRWIGYNAQTIWRWVRGGILPARQVRGGRRWLIKRSDVQRLLTPEGEEEQ
jgi:excisionase family DNA binding protein